MSADETRSPTNFHASVITYIVHRSDTWWTVVPKKAAAVATEMSANILIKWSYFNKYI